MSKDGYICDWRECEFTCCKKDELDRHVYYHAFHTKIKSMGAVVMEERNEKVSFNIVGDPFNFSIVYNYVKGICSMAF